jgi:AcrR family transcriptional regulator
VTSAAPRALAEAGAASRTTAERAPSESPCCAPALELRDACIEAARAVICRDGIENLSLRDVARQLGVSHQAPYKHYPSRDHLLAEVVRRCFQQFAAQLDARERFDDPRRDLDSLGRQYLLYARLHPLEYRLMFGTPWPAAAAHPELTRDALHAFDVLRQVLRRLHGDAPAMRERVDLDALFVWSSMHGLAGVLSGNCIDKLELPAQVLEQAMQHVMGAVARGIEGAAPT